MDGIDICGDRLVREIKEVMSRHPSISKLSMVGYSLGGLIARYAVGQLFLEGFFDAVQPVNFVTFATPHLGARRRGDSTFNYLWNYISPRISSHSGMQMFLADAFEGSLPLLCVMSLPDGPYFEGLKMFQNLAVYSNILNDRTVPFTSAAIHLGNPFRHLSQTDVSKEYPHILATADLAQSSPEVWISMSTHAPLLLPDGTNVAIQGVVASSSSSQQQHPTRWHQALDVAKFMLIMIPVGPVILAVMLFISVVGLFSRLNAQKLRSRLNRASSSLVQGPQPTRNAGISASAMTAITATVITATSTTTAATTTTEKPHDERTEDPFYRFRRQIAEHLNRLPWKKVAVRIRGTLNSHDSIIVRSETMARLIPAGEDVVTHFVENLVL